MVYHVKMKAQSMQPANFVNVQIILLEIRVVGLFSIVFILLAILLQLCSGPKCKTAKVRHV